VAAPFSESLESSKTPVHDSPNTNAPSAGAQGPSHKEEGMSGTGKQTGIFNKSTKLANDSNRKILHYGGIVLAVLVVGVIIFVVVRKRRTDPMRQSLMH
jgi:hypothetical protein